MKRSTSALAVAALSVLVLGTPLMTGCSNFAAYMALSSADQKYETGDYQGAIADWGKAIEINPQYADAYYNRGNAKRDLKDYQGAIADYSKAIQNDPQFADAYANRGLVKSKLGDENGFCTDAKKAASLGAQSPAQWLNSEDGAWCRNMR